MLVLYEYKSKLLLLLVPETTLLDSPNAKRHSKLIALTEQTLSSYIMVFILNRIGFDWIGLNGTENVAIPPVL